MKNGRHLGYQDGTVFKNSVSPTFGLGEEVVNGISRWLSQRNNFCISESPCHPSASNHVSAQSDYVWVEMWFQEFQDDDQLGY